MDQRGWETIWRTTTDPGRFASFAPPNESVAEWARHLPAGAGVVDLGCGVGRHVTYLGGLGFRVAGADIAPTGVERAIAACAERGITLDGRVCDMTGLPWPDATFDAALSTSTIHHGLRADILRALDEVWRVLKPGGQFLVDFPYRDGDDYTQLRADVAAGRAREVEPDTFVVDQPRSGDDDGFLPHHYCDEAEVRTLLQRFTIVRVEASFRQVNHERRGKWVAWAHKPGVAG